MRNNTNFMETGVLSALQFTAAFPKVVLENFYLKSRNSIESGREGRAVRLRHPGRPEGHDPRGAARERPAHCRASKSAARPPKSKLKEGTFPAGSFVVKRDQPYGRLAKILLEKQDFPDPSLRTYDDTGWTMGLMIHAEVKPIADKAILDVQAEPVRRTIEPSRDG